MTTKIDFVVVGTFLTRFFNESSSWDQFRKGEGVWDLSIPRIEGEESKIGFVYEKVFGWAVVVAQRLSARLMIQGSRVLLSSISFIRSVPNEVPRRVTSCDVKK